MRFAEKVRGGTTHGVELARLHAAAPDLLAACEAAVKLVYVALDHGLDFPARIQEEIIQGHSMMKQLKAAIAKARGTT